MKEIYIDYAVAARKLNAFGYTLFPLKGKGPAVRKWKKFIGKKQSIGELNKLFTRFNITGLGIVLQNNLRVLDIDGTEDIKVVNTLLNWLGLSKEYKHIVKSGNGFHIYVYCKDEKKIIEKYFGSGKARYKIEVKDEYNADHIDLLMRDGYLVGPYSLHPSGKKYLFVNGEPEKQADVIKPERVLIALKKICPVRKKEIVNKGAIEYDSIKLQSVSDYLKNVRLYTPEWIQCGFALAQIGEEGRKYFLNLSINNFYPDDTQEYLNEKYNKLLKSYKKNKTTLGTLYYLAQKGGYKIPKADDIKQSAEFLEFVLCVLSYPEKDKKKLLKIILHYAMIENTNQKKIREKIKADILEPLKKRMQAYESKKSILQNHKRMKEYIISHTKKYGAQPYCRIGENYFLESIQGKFDYMTFTLLCAITAIQGKKAKWKIISKERMRAAINGYKSAAIFKAEKKNNLHISNYQIRERVKRLRKLNIISHITVFRNSYYSTRIKQKQLMNLAVNRYNENYLEKLENDSLEQELSKKIREDKGSIKKKFFEKLKRKIKIKSNANNNYVN